MTAVETVDGPIYFGAAVTVDGVIQAAWLQPNIVIAARDPMAGWTALRHAFRSAATVNRYARRMADREIR